MHIKQQTLGTAVFRIVVVHGLFVGALWISLLPAKLVDSEGLWSGALFMAVNFLLLSWGISSILKPVAEKGRIRTGIALLVLKFILFLAVLYALLIGVRLEPLSFALGFTCLLFAVVFERVWACRVTGD
jgi:hypothetical protein